MPIINPDWVPPIEATFDEGKPVRAEQGLMLAGNPIAMHNGAPGSPVDVMGWHGINQTVHGAGDASALIWDHAVDGDITSIEVDPIQPGYEYRVVFDNIVLVGIAGNADFVIDFDSGSGFFGQSALILRLAEITGDGFFRRASGEAIIQSASRAQRAICVLSNGGYKTAGGLGDAYTDEALTGFVQSSAVARTAQFTAVKFRIRVTGMQIGSGKIWVYKRRVGGL